MDQLSIIKKNLLDSIDLKQQVLNNAEIIGNIEKISSLIVDAYRMNKKVLFCGNGGSAADAQHLAAEFSGRYYYDRPPLYAEALHTNTSYLTAVANDYSYEEVYSRLLKAVGKEGDILFGLSTSGNSKNVVNAFKQAKELGVITIALTGESGGNMKDLADININIPSTNTPRIQELHMLIGHSICEYVELSLFPK